MHLENPIIVEQFFDSTIQKIWNALTELEQMKIWFFNNIDSFEPKVGFRTQFVIQNENRTFTHLWKITEVIQERKISYNWKYKEYTGDSDVTFELIAKQDGVLLRVTHLVLKGFPKNIPEFEPENGLAGWQYFIQKNLKKYLNTI